MMSMRRAATLGPPEAGVATYNVVAAFPSPESARMAADALGRVPIPADRITLTPAEEGLAGQWPAPYGYEERRGGSTPLAAWATFRGKICRGGGLGLPRVVCGAVGPALNGPC